MDYDREYPFIREANKLLLEGLRISENLEEVVSGHSSELQKILALRNWIKSLWPNSEPAEGLPSDAFSQLILIRAGVSGGWCSNYVSVFIQACLAMGINARYLGLTSDDGSGHNVAEVYSEQLSKWIVMDVDYCTSYISEDGMPLNALEINQKLAKVEPIVIVGSISENLVRVAGGTQPTKKSDILRYYQSFSILMRNDFMSRLSTPTPPNFKETVDCHSIKRNPKIVYRRFGDV